MEQEIEMPISSTDKVCELLRIAMYAMKREDRGLALDFIRQAQDEIERPRFPLTPQDAAIVAVNTIREGFHADHFERVLQAQRLTQ